MHMWNHEYGIDTDAAPEVVWGHYMDLTTWPIWNPGIKLVELHGPFAAGSEGTITSEAYGPVPFRLSAVTTQHSFTMETQVDENVFLRTICRVAPLTSGGARITHRLELAGPGNEALGEALGPGLTTNLAIGARALAEAAA